MTADNPHVTTDGLRDLVTNVSPRRTKLDVSIWQEEEGGFRRF